MADVSPLTIGLSAAVSVVTGYIGTLLNFNRQRNRARRTYGLAILSEIKTLQRVFRAYHGVLGTDSAAVRTERLPSLRLTAADLNVFGFNSGQIGLFSIRTAVEVIEFYSRVRAVIAEADGLKRLHETTDVADGELSCALYEHLRSVVVLRQHSHTVASLLRRELPVLLEDRLRASRRLLYIARRRRLSLLRHVRRSAQATVPPMGSVPQAGNDAVRA